jgi:hypothetical protein
MMKTMNSKFKLSVAACFFLFLISSCVKDLGIEGSGVIVTQYVDNLPDFSGILSNGDYDVLIEQGNTNSYEVKLIADKNFVPYISFFVSNHTLTIQNLGNHYFKNSKRVQIEITVPYIEYVELADKGLVTCDYVYNNTFMNVYLSGSGTISMQGLDTYDVKATISGSGDIEMEGAADTGEFLISGAGNILSSSKSFGNLELTNCQVDITGSGAAYVFVFHNLDVNISGSGTVYYNGNPHIFTDTPSRVRPM